MVSQMEVASDVVQADKVTEGTWAVHSTSCGGLTSIKPLVREAQRLSQTIMSLSYVICCVAELDDWTLF